MTPRRLLPLGAAAAFALVAAGCGSKQDVLRPESHPARRIDHLWWIMMAGAWIGFGVVVLLVTKRVCDELRAGERVKGGPVGAVE